MKKLLALILVAGSVYAEQSIINTFTAGELSPHMDARVDFEKYKAGCRVLENFFVLPYGGAQKRPGTQYIADTKSNGVARLAPFSVGVDQTYVMEMGQEYIRFYAEGVQLLDTNDVPIEVSTPYSTNDIFEIQMAQFADTMYIAHEDYPVQKLQRTSVFPDFSISELKYSWPPVIEENITDITITPKINGDSVSLSASEDLWTTNHIGADWVLRSPNKNGTIEIESNGTSDPINVEGDWELLVQNIEGGESLIVQVSEDGGDTWGDYREYGGVDNLDYDRSGVESEQGVKYRLVMEGDGFARLKCEEPYINGFVTITNYIAPGQVSGIVKSELGSTNATEIWYEGAFSEERGYPRTVEFFQNRLWFGGTSYLVNTMWASATDDYENFKTGVYDDSALQLAINSDNIIEWLLARNQLFIGTLGDEWILDGGDSSTPVSPTAVLARRQTGFGSRDGIDALIASDSLVYLQRQGRKLREFEYSLESDSYESTDITLLAEHITEGGVVQIAEQQQPEPIIWCVRGDGEMVGMTYNKMQNVYGWHRHTTKGTFESVAVIPTAGEDEIYVVVKRKNGRFVERFRPVDWGDDENAWFVDSGLAYDGGESVEITRFIFSTNLVHVASGVGPLNGTYEYATQTNGYGMWTSGNNKVFRDNYWQIWEGTNVTYASTTDSFEPWNATWKPVIYTSISNSLVGQGFDLSNEIRYWFDSEGDESSKNVYYDMSGEYARWYDGSNWVFSAVTNVGKAVTNRVMNYPLEIKVSEAGVPYSEGNYVFRGILNGLPRYAKEADLATNANHPGRIFGSGGLWYIARVGVIVPHDYKNTEWDGYPRTDGWEKSYGSDPVPTVSFGWNWSNVLDWTATSIPTNNAQLSGGPIIARIEPQPFMNDDQVRIDYNEWDNIGFVGLKDGIVYVANSTPTNFTLVYESGVEVLGYGSSTSIVEATGVQRVFTNVAHLAGQEVDIYADGGVRASQTVSSNGVLVTDDYHNHVIAGLPYDARLCPMFIETVSQEGTSYGKVKNPYKVHFRVYESGVFKYGSSTNDLYPVTIRGNKLPVGQPVPFFSGDPTTLPISIEPDTDPVIWVVSEEPLPLELLSLTIFTSVTEYE